MIFVFAFDRQNERTIDTGACEDWKRFSNDEQTKPTQDKNTREGEGDE